MWVETVCFLQTGTEAPRGLPLRPIVSINLISSGYDLEKVEEDETVKFKLIKDN